jgi:hypothetical protein
MLLYKVQKVQEEFLAATAAEEVTMFNCPLKKPYYNFLNRMVAYPI